MLIQTSRRALELPEPTSRELIEFTGSRHMAQQQRPLLLAAFRAGARAAMEAMESARGQRREEELMSIEL